ncbi:MAG TPA: glycosyltransferase family 8 protein [Acidimicrobiia bacterium]|nr:glycosyltransferase family 8 protein [Acidimicrobiia bacterium]
MTTDPRLRVVLATDRSYALPTAVTLRSLLLANAPSPVDVTILHDAVDASTRALVDASAPEGASGTVEWIDLHGHAVASLPPGGLAPAAWFRLAIPEVVGPGTRVVYLDTDVLVRQSLQPLASVELGGAAIGAIRSVNFPSLASWGAVDEWRELGLPPRAPYFNSGVVVVDTDAWLDAGVDARVLELVESGIVHRALPDQKALNIALCGRWRELDPTWNQQTPLLDDRKGAHLLYTDEVVDRVRHEPAVVHFSDRPKPWHRDSTHPFRHEWRSVANETAFAPIKLIRPRLAESATWRAKRAAAALVRGK